MLFQTFADAKDMDHRYVILGQGLGKKGNNLLEVGWGVDVGGGYSFHIDLLGQILSFEMEGSMAVFPGATLTVHVRNGDTRIDDVPSDEALRLLDSTREIDESDDHEIEGSADGIDDSIDHDITNWPSPN